jgi:hypothetical protein
MAQCCKKIISVLFSIVLLIACEKESAHQTIPFAPVNFTIDLNGADYQLKEPISSKVFYSKRFESDRVGYAGLLIVSDDAGSGIYAFDLCCPVECDRNIRVEPTDDGKAKCKVCGSVFVTMYGIGNVEQGPSKNMLQRYGVREVRPGVFNVLNNF